jgi:hypothetical protein
MCCGVMALPPAGRKMYQHYCSIHADAATLHIIVACFDGYLFGRSIIAAEAAHIRTFRCSGSQAANTKGVHV